VNFNKQIFIFLLLTLVCISSYSQQVQLLGPSSNQTLTTEKLAIQYYEQKAFEKANIYFDELFNKSAENWFSYYYKSLLAIKDYSKAEKITKKFLKEDKNNTFLYVRLGQIYKLQNNEKKEKEFYDKAIKDLIAFPPYVQNLATAFLEAGQYTYAIDSYQKGRNATPEYPYYFERAEVFKAMNDLKAMINELLDAIDFKESDIQLVKINLQNSLGYNEETGGFKNPLLKEELQKRIQKNPDKIAFIEFLIFVQLQQKDFYGAFIQSKSLDKRLNEDGQRMYELAKLFVTNKQWSVSKQCFDYIILKGPSNLFFDAATIDKLSVEFLSLTESSLTQREAFISLEANLLKANEKYKNSYLSSGLIKDIASLKAYYLDKSSEAIILLEDYLLNNSLEIQLKAELKLMLADIYLISGEIWEASLLYSQVEKDFKYEAIGQEAKFRNAKLSFYAGDFAWAKSQADVLKGATTKLISNDALDLSLIISDAIAVDTNEAPLKLFACADLMIRQHKYEEAIVKMDSINLLYSSNTLGDDIYFKKAQIYMIQKKYKDVESMYKNILEYYPNELYADDAQFKLGELYEYYLSDKEKAKQIYQELLLNFSGSTYAVDARTRYRELRGDAPTN
jgi:tetratricopeptide (TPR) repeat protein